MLETSVDVELGDEEYQKQVLSRVLSESNDIYTSFYDFLHHEYVSVRYFKMLVTIHPLHS